MVHIEELILQVPGVTEEEALHLGKEVAQHVADGLPTHYRDSNFGALDLRLTIPPASSRSRMVTLIAEAILKGQV